MRFPPKSLNNQYLLLRAGETVAERNDCLETNPIATLGPSSYLTDKGVAQVRESARKLRDIDIAGGSQIWVYFNKAAASQQSAVELSRELGISVSNLVPDFAWLDPRGVGAFEGKPLAALDAIHMADAADPLSRPAPGEDGTPNESAEDVLVRVRNIISILETSYSGADVVLISPSSDVLSVLRAAALGLPLSDHPRMALRPGELARLELPPPPATDSGAPPDP